MLASCSGFLKPLWCSKTLLSGKCLCLEVHQWGKGCDEPAFTQALWAGNIKMTHYKTGWERAINVIQSNVIQPWFTLRPLQFSKDQNVTIPHSSSCFNTTELAHFNQEFLSFLASVGSATSSGMDQAVPGVSRHSSNPDLSSSSESKNYFHIADSK